MTNPYFEYFPSTELTINRKFVLNTRVVVWTSGEGRKNVSICNSEKIPFYLTIPLYGFKVKALKTN